MAKTLPSPPESAVDIQKPEQKQTAAAPVEQTVYLPIRQRRKVPCPESPQHAQTRPVSGPFQRGYQYWVCDDCGRRFKILLSEDERRRQQLNKTGRAFIEMVRATKPINPDGRGDVYLIQVDDARDLAECISLLLPNDEQASV